MFEEVLTNIVVVLLLLCISTRSCHAVDRSTVPMPTSTIPSSPSSSSSSTTTTTMDAMSFNFCRARLARSDTNRDNSLSIGEYVSFCNQLSADQWTAGHWTYFENMPQPLQDNYLNLILANQDILLKIYGVKPSQRDVPQGQLDFIERVCSSTTEALFDSFTFQDVSGPGPDVSFIVDGNNDDNDDDENNNNNGSITFPSPDSRTRTQPPTDFTTQSPSLPSTSSYSPTQYSTQSPTLLPTQQLSTQSPTNQSTTTTQSMNQSILDQQTFGAFWGTYGKIGSVFLLIFFLLGIVLHHCYNYCKSVDNPKVDRARETKQLGNTEEDYEIEKLVPSDVEIGRSGDWDGYSDIEEPSSGGGGTRRKTRKQPNNSEIVSVLSSSLHHDNSIPVDDTSRRLPHDNNSKSTERKVQGYRGGSASKRNMQEAPTTISDNFAPLSPNVPIARSVSRRKNRKPRIVDEQESGSISSQQQQNNDIPSLTRRLFFNHERPIERQPSQRSVNPTPSTEQETGSSSASSSNHHHENNNSILRRDTSRRRLFGNIKSRSRRKVGDEEVSSNADSSSSSNNDTTSSSPPPPPQDNWNNLIDVANKYFTKQTIAEEEEEDDEENNNGANDDDDDNNAPYEINNLLSVANNFFIKRSLTATTSTEDEQSSSLHDNQLDTKRLSSPTTDSGNESFFDEEESEASSDKQSSEFSISSLSTRSSNLLAEFSERANNGLLLNIGASANRLFGNRRTITT